MFAGQAFPNKRVHPVHDVVPVVAVGTVALLQEADVVGHDWTVVRRGLLQVCLVLAKGRREGAKVAAVQLRSAMVRPEKQLFRVRIERGEGKGEGIWVWGVACSYDTVPSVRWLEGQLQV